MERKIIDSISGGVGSSGTGTAAIAIPGREVIRSRAVDGTGATIKYNRVLPISSSTFNELTDFGRVTEPLLAAGSVEALISATGGRGGGNQSVTGAAATPGRTGSTGGDATGIIVDTSVSSQLQKIRAQAASQSSSLGSTYADVGSGSDDIPVTAGVNSNERAIDDYPGADVRGRKQQGWHTLVRFLDHKHSIYELSPTKITKLFIQESATQWWTQGYLIIDNTIEGWERSTDQDGFYQVRGDGRDEVYINIKPAPSPGEPSPDPELWNIDIFGVIYDVEDMLSPNSDRKFKKVYFWDKKFHLMQERMVSWSTATGPRDLINDTGTLQFKSVRSDLPIAHVPDQERSMYTGEAVASVLTAAGFGEYIDTTKWDLGASKICYTARSDLTIHETIQDILKYHVYERNNDADIAGLTWDRGTQKFNLMPAISYYEKSGADSPKEYQIEHLFLQGQDEGNVVSPEKAPITWDDSTTIDIKSSDVNIIGTYQLSQMSGADSSAEFVSKPVYSHRHKKKQFQVDAQENEISAVRNYIKDVYIKEVRGDSPLLTLNKTKLTGRSISHRFALASNLDPLEDRLARGVFGRVDTIRAAHFLNLCLSTRLIGTSFRQPNRYIGVDRVNQTSDTIYDYQLCGQYYVVEVNHIVQGDKYVNDVTMIKIHSYKDIKPNEEIV